MINGVHAIIFTRDAEADRAFLRDVLDLPSVDAGGGWLIFSLPPAELAAHPTDGDAHHELYLMCDDVRATVGELRAKGVRFTREISAERFGLVTAFRLPGGSEVALYEPRHMTATSNAAAARQPKLLGQTVVVIGGSAGIGLETARLARTEGAHVVLTGRNPERLEQAARDIGARSTAAFDADDAAGVKRFFDDLPAPIDHVLIAAYSRRPSYGAMLDSPSDEVGQAIGGRVTQVLEIARHAAPKMRPGGTLVLTGGSVKKIARESGISPAGFAVLPPFTAALALELAPVRVNLIQAGFVDTALAASYFADAADVEARREELRATLPIRRVVEPADVAELAVHLMTNTAITGAAYDIDGGQQLIA